MVCCKHLSLTYISVWKFISRGTKQAAAQQWNSLLLNSVWSFWLLMALTLERLYRTDTSPLLAIWKMFSAILFPTLTFGISRKVWFLYILFVSQSGNDRYHVNWKIFGWYLFGVYVSLIFFPPHIRLKEYVSLGVLQQEHCKISMYILVLTYIYLVLDTVVCEFSLINITSYYFPLCLNRNSQSSFENSKDKRVRGIGSLDKTMWAASPLECYINIQWKWKSYMGKV